MTVAEAIIGVLGAGILGLLCFFLQAIKSDIRALATRLDRSEAILVNVLERLTKIETVQAEHGRKLDEHGRILEGHGRKLDEHGRILEGHSRILAGHGRILQEHGRKLDEHSRTLEEHGGMLAQIVDYGERITALESMAAAG